MKWLKLIGITLLVLTLFHIYEVNGAIIDEWSIDNRWTVRQDLWNATVEPPPDPPPPYSPPTPPTIPSYHSFDATEIITLGVGTRFMPNSFLYGGLHTEYVFVIADYVSNITFSDDALRVSKTNGLFWANTTTGQNSTVNVEFWFRNIGGNMETRFTPNETLTFDVYVANLGEPTQIYGASSWTFSNQTNILNLVAPQDSEIRILWQFDPIGEYFFLGLGLGGFVFVGVGCFYSTRRLRNINTDDDILQVSWGLLVALVGVGLIIVWLWP